jgi:hypothetical protein
MRSIMTARTDATRPRNRRWALAAVLAAGLAVLVAPVALAAPITTDPEPDLECPAAFGNGLITKYVTTVNTPSDSMDWWVSIEFTVADEAEAQANCEITLASYELPGPDFAFPQTLFDSATGTFGAGTHTLSVDLPRDGEAAGCFSQYDFVFGPAIQNLTFDDRYADRQIRSRIVGTEACPAEQVAATPTPTPTPEQQAEAGTPTPKPSVPNTSMTSGGGGTSATLILGIVLLVALGALGCFNLRAVVTTRIR